MHSILEILEDSDSDVDGNPDLISLADLKLELGITDDSEDAALTARIRRKSNLIAEYCNRRFAFARVQETFIFDGPLPAWPGFRSGGFVEGRQGAALTLTLTPVFEIESVVMNDALLADDGFECDTDSGLLWFRDQAYGGFWGGRIVVIYSGGYRLPEDAPGMLANALIEQIRIDRLSSASSTAGDSGISSVQDGETRITYFNTASASTSSGSRAGFAPSVVDMLKSFRRVGFA